MPDDNRFAGLSDAMDDEESAAADTDSAGPDATDTGASSTEADGSSTDRSDEADDPSSKRSDEAQSTSPRERPAFAFEETTPKSIYVREETLTVLEDTEFDVEAILRQEHDVRNVTGREFHDAAVRVLADHADEVAERVLADRTDDA